MTLLYLLSAIMAAVLFYLASPRQKLCSVKPELFVWLRPSAVVLSLLAWLLASQVLGLWTGLYAALTALMFALVALPFIDALRSR